MNNYLLEIENEFSRLRGRASRLSPLDWNLAQSWEDKGVPLRIVLNAMNDGFKKFQASKPDDSINSLRYFTSAVEKQFAEWQKSQVGKSQVGKSMEVKNDMKFAAHAISDKMNILEYLIDGFTVKTQLPEPLAPSVKEIRRDLINLIGEVESKQLSTDDIENRLNEMAIGLALPMIMSVSEAEREAIIAKINADYSQIKLDDDSRAKILIRQLYDRFGLPELTLFEI